MTPAEAKRLAAKAKRERWEMLFAEQILRAGLPPPIMQFPFAIGIGRKWRADFCWVDYGLIVEIQGGGFTGGRHTRGTGYEDDCERQSTAATLGYTIMPVTPRHVREGKALAWITEALNARMAARAA